MKTKVIQLGERFQEAKKKGHAQTMKDIRSQLIIYARQGVSQTFIAQQCGITQGAVNQWIKGTKKNIRVGFRYGKSIRYDVRTKCHAIKTYIEDQASIDDIIEEYGVSEGTVYNWIKKFGNNYTDYLDAPNGIATLANEDRLIYGEEAIEIVRAHLGAQVEDLKDLMIKIQEYGLSDKEVKAKISKIQRRIKHTK